MNRVDEALRRAADLAAAGTTEHHNQPSATEPVWGPISLDMYPVEHAPDGGAPVLQLAPRIEELSIVAPAAPVADDPSPIRIGGAYEGKLVQNASAHPFSMEQYGRLAAAVEHHQVEQGLNRLMVSSSVPGEGKTLTIVNLAMTLSKSYTRRVLLVDADLRSPSIHGVFGIPNVDGLCEALQSNSREVSLTRVSQRLWVLPAGALHGDPLTVLASPRMAELLEDLATQFDWVLLDAPPVALMPDAGLLVRLTRAAVLVIGAGSTPHSVVEKAVADLGRDNIVGTVLNRIEGKSVKWSNYYGRR